MLAHDDTASDTAFDAASDAPSDSLNRAAADRDDERLAERVIEVETLLQAVAVLHREGVLTETEYEAKHRRLVAQR